MPTPEDRSPGGIDYSDIFLKYGYGPSKNKPQTIEADIPPKFLRRFAPLALALPLLLGCAAPQTGRVIANETAPITTPEVVPEKTPIVVNTLLGNPTSEQATSPELTKYIQEHGGKSGSYVNLNEKNSFGTMPRSEFHTYTTSDGKLHVATRQDGKIIDEIIEVKPIIDPKNPAKVKGVTLVRPDKPDTDLEKFFFAVELINPIGLDTLNSSTVDVSNIAYILYIDTQGRYSIQLPDMNLGSGTQQQAVALAVYRDYHIPISPSASISLTGNETPTVVPSATEAPKATAVPTRTPVPTEAPTRTLVPTEKLTAKQVFDELKADERYKDTIIGDDFETAFDGYIVLPKKVKDYDYGFTPQQIGRIKQILDGLFTWAKTNNPEIIEMIKQSNTRYMICYPTMHTDSGNTTEPDILIDAINRRDIKGIRGIELTQAFFSFVLNNQSTPDQEIGVQMECLIHEFARQIASIGEGCLPGHRKQNYNDEADLGVQIILSKMVQPSLPAMDQQKMEEVRTWSITQVKTSSCLKKP